MKPQKTICQIIKNEIEAASAESIAPISQYLQQNHALPTSDLVFPVGTLTQDGRLDLCKQQLGAQGAALILDALSQNQTVKHLLLGTNAIGDAGAQYLAQAIRENDTLETLYLGCNKIESAGAIAICEALHEHKTIESLWFKRNPIGKESLTALMILLQKNKNITTLDLVNTCLEDAFYDFFYYLNTYIGLERLYLSGNYLTDNHIRCLSDSLKEHNLLKALFLSVNNFGDEGAQYLAQALSENTHLEELSVASCGIGTAGFSAMIEALYDHKTIKYLDLGYASSTVVLQSKANCIDDFIAEKLLDLLYKNPNIVYLNLSKTGLPEKYKAAFANFENRTIVMDKMKTDNKFVAHPHSKAIKSVYR
jgi:Ran GTPase-activating protein (RanGAP) involved in mRNA processing and transport